MAKKVNGMNRMKDLVRRHFIFVSDVSHQMVVTSLANYRFLTNHSPGNIQSMVDSGHVMAALTTLAYSRYTWNQVSRPMLEGITQGGWAETSHFLVGPLCFELCGVVLYDQNLCKFFEVF